MSICKHEKTRCSDSRPLQKYHLSRSVFPFTVIRVRRIHCQQCGVKLTTFEIPSDDLTTMGNVSANQAIDQAIRALEGMKL